MSEWRDVALGEVIEDACGAIRTGPFGSQLHAHEYTDDPSGIPVVMPRDMIGGRVARVSVSRVDKAVAERLKVHRLEPGDLVLARRGDVGRLAFIMDDEAGWLCGTGAMRIHVSDRTVICPRFLRHAMENPQVTKWLLGHAIGATMPNLNAAIVATIPLNMRAALPNASFLGFTGTPLIAGEAERTREVFGDYVSIYNLRASIEDGATVPLFYENRIPELQITNERFDEELSDILEAAELDDRQERALTRRRVSPLAARLAGRIRHGKRGGTAYRCLVVGRRNVLVTAGS